MGLEELSPEGREAMGLFSRFCTQWNTTNVFGLLAALLLLLVVLLLVLLFCSFAVAMAFLRSTSSLI